MSKEQSDTSPKPINLRGWVTPSLDTLTWILAGASRVFFESRIDSLSRQDPKATAKRAKQVDIYVIVGLVLEVLSFFAVTAFHDDGLPGTAICGALTLLVCFRILEILAAATRIALFDRRMMPATVEHAVASRERIVVLGFVNYCEFIVCFAVVYAWAPHLLGIIEPDWFDPFYLSAISQLTIGYGELHPESWLRPIACIQGLFALALILLLIGRFISMIDGEKSLEDELRKQPGDDAKDASGGAAK